MEPEVIDNNIISNNQFKESLPISLPYMKPSSMIDDESSCILESNQNKIIHAACCDFCDKVPPKDMTKKQKWADYGFRRCQVDQIWVTLCPECGNVKMPECPICSSHSLIFRTNERLRVLIVTCNVIYVS